MVARILRPTAKTLATEPSETVPERVLQPAHPRAGRLGVPSGWLFGGAARVGSDLPAGTPDDAGAAQGGEREVVDTVVVGAGVAGLSAALFLGRAGRSTPVYDGGPPRIAAVELVREYLGFDGRTPAGSTCGASSRRVGYKGTRRPGSRTATGSG